jgi:hypothetical protein
MRFGLAGTLIVVGAIALAACEGGSAATPTPTGDPSTSNPPASFEPAPPVAVLMADGAEIAGGHLGSYSIDGQVVDSPWLPGAGVTVSAGTPLSVELGRNLTAAEWRASYVFADPLGNVPQPLDAGRGAIEFVPPPGGHWSLRLDVQFGTGGNAAFYWDVLVEQP